MLEPVELVAALAPVVAHDRRIDRDVHPRKEQAQHGSDEHIDVQWSAGLIRIVGQDQASGDRHNDGDDGLEVNSVNRRAMLRVDRREPARQQARSAHREERPGCRCRPGVGVGERAVDDGEDHQDPAQGAEHLGRHVAPRVAVVEGHEARHLVRAKEDGGAVIVEHVEGAHRDGGGDDRPRDAAPRIPCLFTQGRGRLETDEGEQAEDHPLERGLDSTVTGDEHAGRVARSRVDDQQQRDEHEDRDLDEAEHHACPRRDLDPGGHQPPQQDAAEHRQDDPQVLEALANMQVGC